MNLRLKLEMLMNEKGLTKAQLSKDTNLPYTTIDSILKRDTFEKVKLSTLQTLKQYFNVSLDYLMDDNVQDKNYGKPQLPITYREQQLIVAYRNNLELQMAIDKLLGLDPDTEFGSESVEIFTSRELTKKERADMLRSRADAIEKGNVSSMTYEKPTSGGETATAV